MNTVLRFLKNSGIFVLGSTLARAVGFLMLPILTRYVAPSAMGYYDLSLAWVTIAYEGLFMNIWVVVLRRMYDASATADRRRPIAGGLVLFLGSTSIYFLLTILLWTTLNIQYLWWVALYGFSIAVSYFYLYATRGLKRNTDFALAGVVAALVTALLNILFLVVFKWDVRSLYWAGALGFTAQIAFLEIRVGILRRLELSWFRALTRDDIRSTLRYALPIGLNAVVFWFVYSFNRVVISGVLTLHENGIFAIAMRWGSLLALVLTAMSFAWQDVAFARRPEDGKFFGRAATTYLSALLVAVAVLLPAVRILFPFLVDHAYAEALWVAPSTLLAAVFSGYFNFVVNIFYAIKDTRAILWGTLAALVVNVAGVYPSIALLRLQGANLSMGLAFLAGVLVFHALLRRRIGFAFNYATAAGALVFPAISLLVYYLLSPWWNLAYFLALSCALSIVGWKKLGPALKERFAAGTRPSASTQADDSPAADTVGDRR